MQKVELEYPIERDGSIVRSLYLRLPTPADFTDLEDVGPGEHAVRMLAILGDLPPALIDEIDGSDLLAALRAVASMLKQSPTP